MNIRTCFAAAVLLAATAAPVSAAVWIEPLRERLAELDDGFGGDLGVYVRDLDGGTHLSWNADQHWYLASGVKVLVAIAALRAVERGELSLDSTVELQADDYVDGAGATNWQPPGTPLSIAYLIEQMITASDNTATDVLIRRIGQQPVNDVAAELMPGCGRITTLADVRRHAYSGFHENARQLAAQDLLELRKVADSAARVARLAELLGVPRSELRLDSLDAAFDAYYASELNAGSLTGYGEMLAALHAGTALGTDGTDYLLGVMGRVSTGMQRIRAGLPSHARFAHKTGTQHRRACDFGIVEHAGRHAVIAACVRGEKSLATNERILREVGAAVQASGMLDPARPIAPLAP